MCEDEDEHRHLPISPRWISRPDITPQQDAWTVFVRPVQRGHLQVSTSMTGRVVEVIDARIAVEVSGIENVGRMAWIDLDQVGSGGRVRFPSERTVALAPFPLDG